MTERNLGPRLAPKAPTGDQDEFGAEIRPNPVRTGLTEPTMSEAAQGVEDPRYLALSITASGISVATKAERSRRINE